MKCENLENFIWALDYWCTKLC